ncbi:MAG: ABC transporter permease [Bryobacteraceae bacterium]
MNTLVHDLRYAVRTLKKSPGFTIVAILTLALGIGANTAIFSFVDGVLLKSLPYERPEELVFLWEKPPGGRRNGISAMNYLDWKAKSRSFESMAAMTGGSITLSGVNEPQQFRGSRVSAAYFDILRSKPAIGRTFTADEDQPGKDQVAVLSHKVWESRFGADKEIIGRSILLNGKPCTVVGVMPAGSAYDRSFTEIWMPLAFEPKNLTRDFHWLRAVGRLKSGVSIEQARAEMDTLGAQIAKDYPDSNKGWGVTVDLFQEQVVSSDLRQSLYILLSAVGAILLIGCANLANLTLARGASRNREVAIRASLGAGRWRLVRQFLTESVLLSCCGGALGLLLGYAMLAGLQLLLPPFFLPRESQVGFDWRVMLFTLGIALLTGIVFGAAPAWQAAKPDLAAAMKDGGRGASSGSARRRLRSALVVSEVALAFILLTGAGLLIRSFMRLQQVETGFDSTNVITMGLPMPANKYTDGSQMTAYVRQIIDRLESVPGVRDVAATSVLPLQGWSYGMPFLIAGQQVVDRANRPACFFKMITPGYFQALGIKFRKGRGLTNQDVKGAPPVTVINETMAKRYFNGQDPIGKRILIQEIIPGKQELGPEVPWEVVGMIADEKISGLDDDKSGGLYVAYAQSPTLGVDLVVRGAMDPVGLQKAIEAEVHQINKDQPLTNIKTMDAIKSESVGSSRLRTMLLGVFAGIALLLASIGIYGVISYSVVQRTHELGVRSALGASGGELLRLVIGGGMLLTGVGVVVGLAGAFALTRLLSSFLFGVTATDPLTIGAVAALLGSVALLACFVPARRAAKVDPLIALRYE